MCGLDSGEGPMVGPLEHGNEYRGFLRGGNVSINWATAGYCRRNRLRRVGYSQEEILLNSVSSW
jgi:hypothetical protein